MFQVISEIHNPENARSACPDGYGLAMPKTTEEQAALVPLLTSSSTSYVWAGAKRVDGVWSWEDGSSMSGYTNWAEAEPSNTPTQSYLCIGAYGGLGKWYDCENTIHLGVACEAISEDVLPTFQTFTSTLDDTTSTTSSRYQTSSFMSVADVGSSHRTSTHRTSTTSTFTSVGNSTLLSDQSGNVTGSEVPWAWIIILPLSCLFCAVAAYGLHRFLRSRRLRARVPDDEEASVENPAGDSTAGLVLPSNSSREVRSTADRMFLPGTSYSVVVDFDGAHGLASAPNALLTWSRKWCGPLMDVPFALWQRLSNLTGLVVAGYFPNDRREVAMLVLTATLFYSDGLTDIGSALVFYTKRHYGYMLWTAVALSSTVFRVRRSKDAKLTATSFLLEE